MRGLAAASDPMRLLHDALAGAVEAVGGRSGLLVGLMDDVVTPLASTGAVRRRFERPPTRHRHGTALACRSENEEGQHAG